MNLELALSFYHRNNQRKMSMEGYSVISRIYDLIYYILCYNFFSKTLLHSFKKKRFILKSITYFNSIILKLIVRSFRDLSKLIKIRLKTND